MVPVGRVGTAYRAARARLPAPRTVYRDLLVLAGAVGLLWFV